MFTRDVSYPPAAEAGLLACEQAMELPSFPDSKALLQRADAFLRME